MAPTNPLQACKPSPVAVSSLQEPLEHSTAGHRNSPKSVPGTASHSRQAPQGVRVPGRLCTPPMPYGTEWPAQEEPLSAFKARLGGGRRVVPKTAALPLPTSNLATQTGTPAHQQQVEGARLWLSRLPAQPPPRACTPSRMRAVGTAAQTAHSGTLRRTIAPALQVQHFNKTEPDYFSILNRDVN